MATMPGPPGGMAPFMPGHDLMQRMGGLSLGGQQGQQGAQQQQQQVSFNQAP